MINCSDRHSNMSSYPARFLSSRSSDKKIVIRKLQECAHFHYENVNLNSTNFEIHLVTRNSRKIRQWSRPLVITQSCSVENVAEDRSVFSLLVRSNGRSFWSLCRTYEDFKFLDRWLHKCCFSRASSKLKPLPSFCPKAEKTAICLLDTYLHRFSTLFGNRINCCCILNWLQMDNKGNKLLVGVDESPVNIPAKAAASAIRNYRSRALDELSFEVGSMISVIDMPPAAESNWWRGKRVCAEKGGVEISPVCCYRDCRDCLWSFCFVVRELLNRTEPQLERKPQLFLPILVNLRIS
ncbi:hypothetical protein GJ496_001989 [Pomphorhynchus laevis]|nr:hypothetical protein GJ496_001989 [Pomphorhynchus laevis]